MKRPPFTHFPDLSAPGVFLREINERDLPFLLETIAWDGQTGLTTEDAIILYDLIVDEYQNGMAVNWVIEDAATGQPAGTIGYYRGFAEEQGEVGFVLLPAFQGKGYMSAALQLVLSFGLEKMQLKRIIAVTKPTNSSAIRLLERADFGFSKPFDETYSLYEYRGTQLPNG